VLSGRIFQRENKTGDLVLKTEEREVYSDLFHIFSLLKRSGRVNVMEVATGMIYRYALLPSTLTTLKPTPFSCRR
jgi:hypothetical protein